MAPIGDCILWRGSLDPLRQLPMGVFPWVQHTEADTAVVRGGQTTSDTDFVSMQGTRFRGLWSPVSWYQKAAEAGPYAAGSESQQRGSERPVGEAVRVKPKLQWSLQYIRDEKSVSCPLMKGADMEWNCLRERLCVLWVAELVGWNHLNHFGAQPFHCESQTLDMEAICLSWWILIKSPILEWEYLFPAVLSWKYVTSFCFVL